MGRSETKGAGEAAGQGQEASRPGEPGRVLDRASTSRAFVVQLAAECGGAPDGAFCGRVQHLATSDGGNFTSAEALVAIIRRILERVRRREEGTDD